MPFFAVLWSSISFSIKHLIITDFLRFFQQQVCPPLTYTFHFYYFDTTTAPRIKTTMQPTQITIPLFLISAIASAIPLPDAPPPPPTSITPLTNITNPTPAQIAAAEQVIEKVLAAEHRLDAEPAAAVDGEGRVAKRGTGKDILCMAFFPFCPARKNQALGKRESGPVVEAVVEP